MEFKELDYDSYKLPGEEILDDLGLKLEESNEITGEELATIKEITSKDKYLEVHDDKYFLDHTKNGFLKLYEGGVLKGFIFAHDIDIKGFKFYERGTLWIDPSLRKHGLGRMLMNKMTQSLKGENILSVTSNPTVQKVNNVIMGYEVINPEGLMKEIIELGGPLHDDYKYYINKKLRDILH